MQLNKYSIPIYNSLDLFNLIYQGNLKFEQIYVEIDSDVLQFESTANIKLQKPPIELLSVEDWDKDIQSKWFIPEEYLNINLEEYLIERCPPANLDRLQEELYEFHQRNMNNLLKWLIYFVDTCKQHNIIWGVGRGSSVASYVLYLLEVHRIDSIRYNLDWREFLR